MVAICEFAGRKLSQQIVIAIPHAGVPQTLSLNLNRIKPSSAAGNQVWLNSAGNALELAEEIRNRCQPGQLYGKLMY